jgi:predicted transcriptional regulator
VHLIYTLNQAYMAMATGAAFVCPLAGRLQDQGHDAITLFEQCVDVTQTHNYSTKIMFSSVRYPEHVRQALLAGVDVCTVPWGVLRRLSDNSLTTVGANQFLEHTRLMSVKVRDVIRPANPVCELFETVNHAMVKMTESRLGAVTVVDDAGKMAGVFTDGDLRRKLQEQGWNILEQTLADTGFSAHPITIATEALLYEAVNLFITHEVDSIVVLENNAPVGMLDIQDLVRLGVLG